MTNRLRRDRMEISVYYLSRRSISCAIQDILGRGACSRGGTYSILRFLCTSEAMQTLHILDLDLEGSSCMPAHVLAEFFNGRLHFRTEHGSKFEKSIRATRASEHLPNGLTRGL